MLRKPPVVFLPLAMILVSWTSAHAQGPGGGFPGGPGGFGPGTFLAPQILEAADADKDKKLTPEEAGKFASDLVRSADEKKAGSVDAQAFAKALNKAAGPPPDLFGGPGGPPPGDFGPGTFFGGPVFEAADSDKDKKLTPKEAETFASAFIRTADAKKAGGLTSDDLAAAINQRMGGPGGPMGGPGGPPMGEERKVVKDFDKDGDGRLNPEERKAARESIKKNGGANRGPFGFGPPGGGPGGPGAGGRPPFFGGGDEPGKPGPKVAKEDAKPAPADRPLYDPTTVRTLFLDFDTPQWESEMADFNNTDVEMPATLTVDGKAYPMVGVHFRGLSSFMMVGEGSKRSLNVSLDFADPEQNLMGYRTLNLLNSHEDSTFLHTALYFHIARNYLAAPKANFVKVVINGESWGLYVNAQQFDKTFLTENFKTARGTRWKVPGNPGARGGLEYLGEDTAAYKARFEIKGNDDPRAWGQFMRLCKVLNETPPDQLESALKPMLDIDGALWFLALDNALINNDGYWTRSSDYNIYLEPGGKFHIIPHDANETFGNAMMMGFGGPGGRGGRGGGRGPGGPGGGPGGPGGPGGGPGGPQGGPGGGRPGGMPGFGGAGLGVELDPLIGLDDPSKPLRSKLLAVPALRKKYLENVRTIAVEWLDWQKLGPVVATYRGAIDQEIEADTRKLMSNEAYHRAVGDEVEGKAPQGRPSPSLKEFAEKRSKYLLNHPEIKKLDTPKG